jgi:hypothetical protein
MLNQPRNLYTRYCPLLSRRTSSSIPAGHLSPWTTYRLNDQTVAIELMSPIPTTETSLHSFESTHHQRHHLHLPAYYCHTSHPTLPPNTLIYTPADPSSTSTASLIDLRTSSVVIRNRSASILNNLTEERAICILENLNGDSDLLR